MGEHHEFSPSTLDRIAICTGSFHLGKGLPDIETKDSKGGQKLHAAVVIKDDSLKTDEEIHVEKCKLYVKKNLEDLGIKEGEYDVYEERKVRLIGNNHHVINDGTPDLIIVPHNYNFVLVFDWKFGRNKVNPATLQLKNYGLACCQEFDKEEAYCHVVQPAIHHYMCMIYQAGDSFRIEEVISTAKDIKNFKLVPGEHCLYCKVKIHDQCQAYKMLESRALAFPEKNLTTANDEEIITLYEIGKSLAKKTEIIKDEIKARIDKNGSCGNYYLKERKGKKKVTHMAALQKAIENLISKKELLDCSSVTLGKLETRFIDNYKLTIDPGATKVSIRAIFQEAIQPFIEYGKSSEVLELK